MTDYFSDRESGTKPRAEQEIGETAWGGVVALIDTYVSNGGFGVDFPDDCPDGKGPTGTDFHKMGLAVRGEVPELEWPLAGRRVPSTANVLDLLEFSYRHVADPIQGTLHSHFDHYHLTFDRARGQTDFRDRANRILARNQLAYTLGEDGKITRLAGPVFDEEVRAAVFKTGDQTLDDLLESARGKFLDPNPGVRREALEKLWDAWERLKSLDDQNNKRASTGILLDRAAAEGSFRQVIEEDARALTDIGNQFRIRHSETQQVEIETAEQVDYLFRRMFSLIILLLNTRPQPALTHASYPA